MLKTKMTLGAVLLACALTPAAAAKKSHGKVVANANANAKPVVPVAAPVSAIRRADQNFDTLSSQYLSALWLIDPEAAMLAGKYDNAAKLSIPDAANRSRQLAFLDDWQSRFAKIDGRQLSERQRTDLALLSQHFQATRWSLTVLREFEWNPASYNIAGPIDALLNTDYAAQPQRLRTLLKRIAGIPAYYAAAQASLINPSRVHTQLAIEQGAGVQVLLDELNRSAQAASLSPLEKQSYTASMNAAHGAVAAYLVWLGKLDTARESGHAFRLGKALYEQKFAYTLQTAGSAEQLYQQALLAREQTLLTMDTLADQLWLSSMGREAKPSERQQKIALLIERLSQQHVGRDDFLPEIRRQLPLLQAWVSSHKLLPEAPGKALVVRAMPLYRSGAQSASIDVPGPYRAQDRAFYNVAPLAAMTPEQVESSLRQANRWSLQLQNMQLALPGQATQRMLANTSPAILKALLPNAAFSAGWGLYSVGIMLDAGYGESAPEMALMYAKEQLRNINNSILDYSVHVLDMSQEQALVMLRKQGFESPLEAQANWRLTQLTSVQLSAAFSGYSDLIELRAARQQVLGDKFDLQNFHRQLLSYGSAPVRVIKELMD